MHFEYLENKYKYHQDLDKKIQGTSKDLSRFVFKDYSKFNFQDPVRNITRMNKNGSLTFSARVRLGLFEDLTIYKTLLDFNTNIEQSHYRNQ